MTFTVIPVGYRITFESWENDADNHRVIIQEGLSHEKATFLSELAHSESGLNNNHEPSKSELSEGYDILKPIFEKYQSLLSEVEVKEFQKDPYFMLSFMADNIFGYSAEGYALRVLSKFKVEYVAQEVQLEDVTAQFI